MSCGIKNKWRDPAFAKHQSEVRKGIKYGKRNKPLSREHILNLRASKIKGHDGPQLRKNGYIYIYAPDHPHRINSRIPEQTLIAEKILGRYLKKGEEVHHINKIRTDNRNCNLLICSHSYHIMIHKRDPVVRNCIKEQARCRPSNVILEYNGKKQCVAEWAREKGWSALTLRARIKRGWSTEKVLSRPIDTRFSKTSPGRIEETRMEKEGQ
jgi:hypothetical protein